MPLYFFHTHYPDRVVMDEDGQFLSGRAEAERMARRSLGELALECAPGMAAGLHAVSVGDPGDRNLFTVSF